MELQIPWRDSKVAIRVPTEGTALGVIPVSFPPSESGGYMAVMDGGLGDGDGSSEIYSKPQQ